jgi:prepilin-type N-terminal cleavage/methylation domain-containing protein/prepilin-type processing-associated H-X9-DG protein
MKTPFANAKVRAFTIVELLVVIAIVAILWFMLLPSFAPTKGNTRVHCMSNQKQIVMGFWMWNTDHAEHFPWQVSTATNGFMEFAYCGDALNTYRSLTPYQINPQLFHCPADKERTVARNYDLLSTQSLSYFIALEASTNLTQSPITGDRNLRADEKRIAPGLFIHSPSMDLNWTRELHYNSHSGSGGNLSFYDGHVQWVRDTNLNSFFRDEQLPTNYFAVP